MPATLSIWACALGLWRRFSAQQGFDPVSHLDYPEVLVDCLLCVSASEVLCMDSSESPFYDRNRVLRSDLTARHADAADVFASSIF